MDHLSRFEWLDLARHTRAWLAEDDHFAVMGVDDAEFAYGYDSEGEPLDLESIGRATRCCVVGALAKVGGSHVSIMPEDNPVRRLALRRAKDAYDGDLEDYDVSDRFGLEGALDLLDYAILVLEDPRWDGR